MLKINKATKRRIGAVLTAIFLLSFYLIANPENYDFESATHVDAAPHHEDADPSESDTWTQLGSPDASAPLASAVLEQIPVKGKAPATGYSRDEFYSNWGQLDGCDMRNIILKRDLKDVTLDGCIVKSGTLQDPYTAKTIYFIRGENSNAVQIDHVVALSDAWKKGAQNISKEQRNQLANDPLNLIAVDGPANVQKSDSDAASWLPKNKAFRCQYIARQISVKYKYQLWLTLPEKTIMQQILEKCPTEPALGVNL